MSRALLAVAISVPVLTSMFTRADTARVLCEAGRWLENRDPAAADRFYKALVRRCGRTPLGALADRVRWFPTPAQMTEVRIPGD